MGVNVQTRYQQIYTTAMSDVQTTMDVDTTPAFTSGYGTIRRGYADQEDIKWRGITGLQLTSLLRGLSPTALTDTEVLGLKKTHSLQSSTALQTFEGTTIHYIINNKTDVDDDETITGNWNFSAKPKMTGIKDSSGNEAIDLDATGSAVNQLRIINSATGSAVTVTTAGDDTDIDHLVSAKGSGKVKLKDGAEMASIAAPTTNAGIANKKYVDDTAAAGSNASTTVAGKVEIATLAESLAGTTTGGSGALLVPGNDNALLTEALNFFNTTSLVGSEAETLHGGGTADSLHTHNYTSISLPAGEAVDGTTTPQAVHISDGTGGRTSGRFYKSDANDTTNSAHHFFGFVRVNASSIGTSYAVQTNGVVSGFTGLTTGATYYLSDTAGAISTSPSSTCSVPIGVAVSATQLYIDQYPSTQMTTASVTGIAAGTNNYDTTVYIPRKAKEIEVLFRVSTRDSVNGPAAGGGANAGQIYSMGSLIFNGAGTLVIANRNFDALDGKDFDHTAGTLREAADFGAAFNRLNQSAAGLGTNVIGMAGGGNTSQCTITITATTEHLVTVRFGFATSSGTGSNGNDFYYAGIIVRS